ncbi:MAG TPA: glutathione S-transferase family protein [Kofleriaceae bacterium]|nr:glutathione S-transferase family protein [Kofleriaceae bacterium]
MTIKLYMHPVSTASRPVWLYCADNKLPVANQVVDLMTGEHIKDEYTAINPSQLVPTLEEEDGWRLTESATILKYLANRFDKPHYPTKDLRKRARIDEVMDWINTQFYRDYGYGLLYPQMFPAHKRPTDDQQKGVIAWGRERAEKWFKVLDTHWLGKTPYLASETITVADYFGACVVATGEVIRCDFKGLPNVTRWLGTMKKLPAWNQVHEVASGFAGSLKDQKFVTV